MIDRAIESGEGTPEADWLEWFDAAELPAIGIDNLLRGHERMVVVAPHPDDEVLIAGGLLATQAARGGSALVVAVTDGGASHCGSSRWSEQRLLRTRPLETANALRHLRADGRSFDVQRLGLPDGRVALQSCRLTDRLMRLIEAADVVLTTWRFDGHPDHEASAAATSAATQQVGARLIEVPVWAWHWATPGDGRIPWQRARSIGLSPLAVRRKQAAIRSFKSQLHPDPSTGEAAVLRQSMVARCDRPFEIVFA